MIENIFGTWSYSKLVMNFKEKKRMNKIKKILTLGVITLTIQGCISHEDDAVCTKYNYMSFDELRKSIRIEAPKSIDNAGKIYRYNHILLVNEPNLGIHVIDNNDTNNPLSKAFIYINGNVDMAVKEGFLYADSFMDLLVFDIRNIDAIQEVNRTNDVFNYDQYQAIDEKERYRCEFNTTNGVVGVKR